MRTLLYLIRHGETVWNHERRIQGHQDPPLNDTGREQARSLGARLTEVAFDAAYASDLRRAWQTAEILVESRGIPVTRRSGLRERHLGRWEGLVADDLATLEPDAWKVWLTRPREIAPHGGESDVELERRAIATLSKIVETHPGGTVLVVSHGGTIRAALIGWLGLEYHYTPNCGVYVLSIDGETRRLVSEPSV